MVRGSSGKGLSSLEALLEEILQPLAISYLHSLGTNSVFKHENAHPHRVGIIRDYLQTLGWPACSSDLNPIEYCRISLGVLFVPERQSHSL